MPLAVAGGEREGWTHEDELPQVWLDALVVVAVDTTVGRRDHGGNATHQLGVEVVRSRWRRLELRGVRAVVAHALGVPSGRWTRAAAALGRWRWLLRGGLGGTAACGDHGGGGGGSGWLW